MSQRVSPAAARLFQAIFLLYNTWLLSFSVLTIIVLLVAWVIALVVPLLVIPVTKSKTFFSQLEPQES